MNETICSHYNHTRYIIYFQPIYFDSKGNVVTNYTYAFVEAYNSATLTKSLNITTTHTISPLLYSTIFLNYTILDGLTISDGIKVKYYPNNNFQG
jgi:hypothetical protein